MKTRVIIVGLLVALVASPVLPQSAASFSQTLRDSWDNIKSLVLESARQLPEADYGFSPTKDVRTFGQILGHLVNEHYAICSAARGETNPTKEDFEKTTAKTAMVKALEASIGYCDRAYAALTDANAFEKVKVFGNEFGRFSALQVNVTHDSEHYGNLVTYLRMKGQVPPSSRRGQ